MPVERLQKILASAGFGSRRSCEQLITAGRVTVNGKIAELGSKADPQADRIAVDGAVIPAPEALVYIALYKPRNVISAVSSPDERRTVRDLVTVPERIFPVGRLDADSEGLMLMTNDGELANRLTHPRYGHEKEYEVLVASRPDEQQLTALRQGIVLEDGHKTAPALVFFMRTQGKGAWLRFILKEGRKRQIREMCGRLALPVVKIIRVRIGSLRLGSLNAGEWRKLTPEEVTELKQPGKSAGKTRSGKAKKPTRSGSSHKTTYRKSKPKKSSKS